MRAVVPILILAYCADSGLSADAPTLQSQRQRPAIRAPAYSPPPTLVAAAKPTLVAAAKPAARRPPRLFMAIAVAWLYNFGIAVAAIQQQYLFNTIFNADGSAAPTPLSAALFGWKKAMD